MRLRYDDDTERFRAELQVWLADHVPDAAEREANPKASSADMPDWARRWQRTLFDHGWLVPGWPPELGGRNATPEQQMVYFEELARLDVPRSVNPQGLGIIAPSLYDAGTEEHKRQYLLPTLKGDITWCVGMSEPDAGSDLASLSTRAEVDGDEFVVTGQKVWTSGAHHADYCMCFVRTDPTAAKHRGISTLIIDMASPGITCRPLPELTDPDYADFNEVFFEDVRVPRDNLVGELHQGWGMAIGSLNHERAMLWVMQATHTERHLEQLRALASRPAPSGDGILADDARFRDTVARLYLDSQALWFLGYKGFAKAKAGVVAPEHMILKLFGSELAQQVCLEATEAIGADAIDVSGDRGGSEFGTGPWPTQYLRSFANTIAGGTSEIQRNIIAERILGLPRA
jgi:alkylation response protein AidB-like acyl-CoA dehydrogenase